MTTEKIVANTTQSQRNATNGISSRSIDHSSIQASPGRNLFSERTSLEMGDGDNGFTDAETTPFQGNATEGVGCRKVGRPLKQPSTSLGVGFRDVGRRRHSKHARTGLEMGDGDKNATDIEKIAADTPPFQGNATKGGRPSKQAKVDRNLVNARTNLEMGGGDIKTTDTSEVRRESSSTSFPIESNIETPLDPPSASYGPLQPKSVNQEQPYQDVADTPPSQRDATIAVTSRSIDHPSGQEMPCRNLINARTNLEMGDGNNGAIETEKFAAETSQFQGNATKGVSFGNIDCPSKQERTDRNLDNAKTCLELDGGDIRTADTSKFNREYSRTSFPNESNFETPLIQPSMSYGHLQPKSGNVEQPCLDDASCVIIDRSTCYPETEKKVVLYDLSVYEKQNREPISDKTCIYGDEGTHTRAQKSEASMAEANNSGTGFINRMTVSNVHKTGMVEDTKASGPMDTTGMVEGTKASGHMDTTGMVQNTNASGHMDTTSMVQNTDASGHMDTTGSRSKFPLGKGNCSKSPLGNGFASPIPTQVHTMDTRKEIKVVKKEQVTLREGASDHLRKQDVNPSWTWKADDDPSTSSLKRKAAKLEPEYSLDEPALFPDSITCLAGTDNCDFINLPARLPSVAFKKVRGRIDSRCSILLIDPEKRKWPAIYLEKFGSFFGVICGWKQFNEANKVLPGEKYVFSLDNKSECRFKVDVVRM